MEPRVAVYRVRNNDSGQAKFGHIWLKPHTEIFKTISEKKLVEVGETLDGIWTVDWREPKSEYINIFGDDLTPEIDIAADLRKRYIKTKGSNMGMSKKARQKMIADAVAANWKTSTSPACTTGTCGAVNTNKYVDKGIEPMSADTDYKPPYTIVYAPEAGIAA